MQAPRCAGDASNHVDVASRWMQEPPENNLHGSVAAAAIMRRCFTSAGYRDRP
jgi:hypothetical protein